MRKDILQKLAKSSLLLVLVSATISGCSDNIQQNGGKKEMVIENRTKKDSNEQVANNETDTVSDNKEEIISSTTQKANYEPKRMVMLNGKLYVDTGETSSVLRCGVMDFEIDSVVSQNAVPTVDNQSNFGAYSGQLGTRENRIEICIEDTWHIFAYNENNLEGVTMEVTKSDSQLAEVTFTSQTDAVVTYGDSYLLEIQDAETGEWSVLPFQEDVGFHDIGYVLKKGETQTWEAVFTYVYGELEPGKYRIIKNVHDSIGTREYREKWLMAEFEVS